MSIERNADILMDLINTKVEIGIKNSQLVKYAQGGDFLASLEGPIDGREGSTHGRHKKAVGTDEDQAIETDADKLLGLGVQEKSNLVHKTFVAQAGAWAEERRLLKKRQRELEEEKRVLEERRVADSVRMSKERREYKSKLEYLSGKVKELQQELAITRGQDAQDAVLPNKQLKGRKRGVVGDNR